MSSQLRRSDVLCDLWDAPPGSIAHAQAQAQIDAEHPDLQEDSQIPGDVEALLNEMACERAALEGGPPEPLGWITPEHQAAMAALADSQAARLRARRENATTRPARSRARPRPVPMPPLVPLQAAEMDQLLDDPVLRLLADELGAVVLSGGSRRPPPG